MYLLIVEDDKNLCSILEYQLKKNKIEADFCHDGADAMFYIEKQSYDILILDRMLPGVDGITLLKRLREKQIKTPVLMLTAMGTLQNRIEGLDTGADDYLIKPFDMEELLARIRALARRPVQLESLERLCFSDFCLDAGKLMLTGEKESCSISKRECDLLTFFIKNKGQVLTRETLLTRVWGADSFVTDGNLDNFICFLRKRFKSIHSRTTIRTIRSVGYQLEE